MTFRLAPLALSAVLLAGCATEKPYLYSDYRYHQIGQVIICSSDSNSTPEQVKAMAEEVCNQYDRTAIVATVQKYQCSWTAPTQSTFACAARPGEHPAPIVPRLAPLRRDQQLLTP
jgi:hypothetical protein